jgi:hypothetical protein
MAGKPFAVLGINTNGYNVAKLKEVMDKEKLTWRSCADPPAAKQEGFYGKICNEWNLEGTPTLYVLDHQGVIRYRWIGSPGEQVIDEALQKLIKEAEEGGKKKSKKKR